MPTGVHERLTDVSEASKYIRLTNPGRTALQRSVFRAMRPGLEFALRLKKLNRLYQQVLEQDDSLPIAERYLRVWNAGYLAPEQEIDRIPKTGPLIVVANHAYGGLDPMILHHLLSRVRDDVRFVANSMLTVVPNLREHFYPVDPFATRDAAKKNAHSLRRAMDWLGEGKTLAIFPAGEVAHITWRNWNVTDPAWNPIVGRLVRRTGATVLPVFFEGRNSNLFQAAGLLHPVLRSALLGRELLKAQGRRVRVAIGKPLPVQRLDRFSDPADLTEFLRLRTFVLRSRLEQTEPLTKSGVRSILRTISPRSGRLEPIRMEPVSTVQAHPPDAIASEILALPSENILLRRGTSRVVHAYADQIPHSLQEIGRLRELSFRAVGEGTGRTHDLDGFDKTYQHLILWDEQAVRIVGAYRFGQTDVIVPREGIGGLYTSTLFNYSEKLINELGPSLELGRSFVRLECQRDVEPLMLLWKGLATFSARNPKYRYQFGAVSISSSYHATSTRLLLAFLRAHDKISKLTNLVRPRNPVDEKPSGDWDPRALRTVVESVDDIDELVNEIESDQRSVPILVRQYLRLNAKFLGFNADPDFNDVVDGLVLVDLMKMDRRLLKFYMGADPLDRFIAYQEELGPKPLVSNEPLASAQ